MKKALLSAACLCILLSGLRAETGPRFKTQPGMAVLGGSVSLTYTQAFTDNSTGLLDLHVSPMYGVFITKDTCVLTHLDFGFQILFPSLDWIGRFGLGVQGRYFFSTEEASNFYLGIEANFGIDLVPDYSQMHEHIMTGPAVGFFIPLNEKTGLDLTFYPLFYLPLNRTQPFAMSTYLSIAMFSVL